jgi:hypothetical protein
MGTRDGRARIATPINKCRSSPSQVALAETLDCEFNGRSITRATKGVETMNASGPSSVINDVLATIVPRDATQLRGRCRPNA